MYMYFYRQWARARAQATQGGDVDRVVTTITECFLIMATVWRREVVKLGERVLSWRLIVHGASTTAIDRVSLGAIVRLLSWIASIN